MILITGQTYPVRSVIKEAGFRWDSVNKVWKSEKVTHDKAIEALGHIRGITIISSDDGESFDTRTHKQKYGRCEDAPCCGCCGNDYNARYY